jgi:threonine aldolase
VRRVIDLRSDTVTQPTEGMRRAIAEAAVGDEQKREDPTVLDLERRVAELLGQEAAVFVPTATMANQIALKLHSRPGDVLLAEEHSHVVVYEYGGAAAHAGLMTRGLPGNGGRLSGEQVRAAAAPSSKVADQRAAVLSLEDTHNNAGGRVWPLDELDEVVSAAREFGLAVHLDGARLLNASAAQSVPPATIAARFDTVTLCLSKGLGCPLGALLAGSRELIDRAWREKHLFGGAMRQAGIVAAAGVYALDHHVERLAEDNQRARAIAEGLVAAGVTVDLRRVETNFVQIDVAELGIDRADALGRMLEAGVGLSATIHPTVVRAVTHLEITDEDVARAIELIPAALGVGVPAGR